MAREVRLCSLLGEYLSYLRFWTKSVSCIAFAFRVLTLPFVLPIDRSPDDASVKQKMVAASSKDALKRTLVGIAVEVQATDFSEITHDVRE